MRYALLSTDDRVCRLATLRSCSFPQHMTITDWFAKWVDGTLYQPWLMQDSATGEWRGATDAEYVAMLQEAFGPDGPEN